MGGTGPSTRAGLSEIEALEVNIKDPFSKMPIEQANKIIETYK